MAGGAPHGLVGVDVLTAAAVVDSLVPTTPALSPDGRWVAYVLGPVGQAGDRPDRALWLTPVDRTTPPRPLTTGTTPRWSPDGQWIYFLTDDRQIGRIHPTGGPAQTLTAWPGGIDDHLPVTTDQLALTAPDDTTPGPSRLRLLNPTTGDLHTPDVFPGRHVAALARRPDGGALAVLTRSTRDPDPGLLESELHLLDPTTGTPRDLGTTAVAATSPVWWRHPDTTWHLAYLATTPPGLVGGTTVIDLATDTSDHHTPTTDLTACPVELVQVDTGPPLVLVADGLDTAIHRLGPPLAEVTRLNGYAGSLTTSTRGDVVAVIASSAYEPKDVHAGPVLGPLTRLTDTNPPLRDIRWGVQERLAYPAPDGLPLDGLLLLPPGTTRTDGPFPLVTLVHGGPYDRHADQLHLGWYPSGQWLATHGYAVFLPNPRGGRGHGHAFAALVAGAVGGDEWTDILTGIDLLTADGVADPDRLGIGGWSHGGFMAAWAVTRTHRFKAALVGAGISDWPLLAATGEEGAFEAALAGEDPHRNSPITHARTIDTPVLIAHGENDTNVPATQAERLRHALHHHGVHHDHVVYPAEPHTLRDRAHQLDLLHRTRAWFDRWLRDRGR
ncbi:S9 family peptidase [Umezawaea endophytica]|uniref:Prolyl oligopeptidase family serine peptidase n=1 Tax=Umezawaea endophytica TaxID=1654476 RepID=A0A9X2VN14_9PSEU|nr:prolyl oligopeptidase family serine peptidase [Umezawaea endophytica]MCS7479620.1 prolyl oligopeptidase family serine peptidase [Umezawaea endophytica]